jgi:sialate O-acetylesterase
MRRLPAKLVGLVALAAMLCVVSPAVADVRLPRVFSDHMVLQRDMPIVVWGWADPGEPVAVTLSKCLPDGTMVMTVPGETRADADGRWAVPLDAADAGGPWQLRIRGPRNGVSLQDVFVGDVWFCSGQSNMYWPVKNSANPEEEIAAANYPKIRSFDVWKDASDRPRDDVYGQWRVCSPKTAGNFSAAAYYFARHLHKELKVPIGIVHASWAATSAHPWMSKAALDGAPKLKNFAANMMKRTGENLVKFKAEFDPKWSAWTKAVVAAKAEGKTPPRRPEVSFRHKVRAVPSALYNGMVAPLTPMNIKGVIWYQGENDAHRGMFYQTIFEALIRDWRKQWRQDELPFLFVQLANYKERKAEPGDSQWAMVRAAQAAALRLPKTGMACTIDIGEAKNIHPKNKQDVGRRLALAALKMAYGRDLVYSGPTFEKMVADGNRAVLTFTHVGGGLKVRGDGPLKGYAVAGKDRKFVLAEARIEGKTVVVTSDAVKEIAAVRYGWADNPECNLRNVEGLPAAPFRTDSW